MHGWLQSTYKDVQKRNPDVVAEITRQHKAGTMLPFRRREFEVNAVLKELLRRSGAPWGLHLPSSDALLAGLAQHRRVRILAEAAVQDSLVADLRWGLQALSPSMEDAPDVGSASHIIVLLTKGTLHEATGCTAVLKDAVQQGRQII